ncbi:MAG: PQQ-binding-like beta-propeller repeat protein [Bauldia sp.]
MTSKFNRNAAARALLMGGVALAAMALPASAATYKLDVNSDRLINADREPQNWIIMNQNYASHRYSRLTQINRNNVKDLKLVFAMALGDMKDVGVNGPENEANPLVDGGFMYAVTGWGTVYKLDVRDPIHPEFLWITDPGVQHEGNGPRTRGIALWNDMIVNALVDGRVVAMDRDTGEILWDKQVAVKNEFGTKEAFDTAPITARNLAQVAQYNGDAGTRGWVAALDVKTGAEKWRFYVVPSPGEPGSETWKDDHNAWKTGGGGIWQTGSYDPAQNLSIWGTGNPVPSYDPEARPGDNLYTDSMIALDTDTGKLKFYFQYVPNESWDYDEIGVHMLADLPVNGQTRKTILHFGRNGMFYSLDRTNGSFIGGAQYVNDLNWTKGLDPKTGKPVEYDPSKNIQTYIPESHPLRGDKPKRTCPTWHGGVAHQPPAFNPVKNIAYGVGSEGCFSGDTGQTAYRSNAGGIDNAKSGKRTTTSDLYYGSITAYDPINQKVIAKSITEIENRSGVLATAGGVVFTALQDGAFVAYNDETLEELYRIQLGTPLKAAPMTYAIGPKQYIAVQAGGRHLHPVKYDNLLDTSYLFVFALN